MSGLLKVDDFCRQQRKLFESDLNTAAENIIKYIQVINGSELAVGHVWASKALDDLVSEIGALIRKSVEQKNAGDRPKSDTYVYIATELYKTGGHTPALFEIIAARKNCKHVIFVTDLFGSFEEEDFKEYMAGSMASHADLIVVPDMSHIEKIKWLQAAISKAAPQALFLFNHWQDVVAVASVQVQFCDNTFYYHHADHHLALGVFLDHAIHIDPHNLGYYNCRNHLHLPDNIYWPIIVTDRGVRNENEPFMRDNQLLTCTTGGASKIEQEYAYKYKDIVIGRLKAVDGVHYHVGYLSDGYLEEIYNGLHDNGINKERFIYTEWVDSIWLFFIDKKIDLYITSFPAGGGTATLECIGSGTPIIMHDSYKTMFHSGLDLAYEGVFTWRDPEEFYALLAGLDEAKLREHSKLGRDYYLKYHHPDVLKKILSSEANMRKGVVPPDLHKPPTDVDIVVKRINSAEIESKRFNDENQSRDEIILEQEAIIQARDINLKELDKKIVELDQQVSDLRNIINVMTQSRSWRVTHPARVMGRIFRKFATKVKKLKQFNSIFRTLLVFFKRKGGIRYFYSKILTTLKKEGVSGVKRRFVALYIETSNSVANGTDRNDYAEWVIRYDNLNDEKRAYMRSCIEELSEKPLISVVMPTYNPKPEWLTKAIESIQKQIYPHWELCIADDLSTDPRIRPLLENFSRNDSRIKVVFRERNEHISAASNSALEVATGEWVALMDHDDMLPEQALFWVVDTINHAPDACMIYSDEDKIDDSDNRHSPYFKCDWNPDLFFSHNMFCHLGVYKRQLIEDVNGFRLGLEGAQDYDLVLRCIEKVDTNQIYHIPRVLYHWRVHSGSTAQSADAKPYAELAAETALNEHFERVGVDASVVSTAYGFRAQYRLPPNPPLVSLIIPTRNGLKLLRQCISSIIKKTTYPNYEIIVVDNASDDPEVLTYFETIASEHKVKILKDERPFNYSQLNNAAVKMAKGEIVGLINNDIEVITPEWLSEMVSHALRPDVGAVGAKLLYPDNTVQHAGVVLGVGGVAGHSHKHFPRESNGYFSRIGLISEFSAVTAACLIIKKSIFNQVGGLNERDLKVAFNDVDFCLRVREAGYRNIWTPYAELYHYESVSRGLENTPEKQERFNTEVEYMKEKWGGLLETDPAYSPNLTLVHQDFSYARPPRTNPLKAKVDG